MNAHLRVRVQKVMDGEQATSGALADVIPIADGTVHRGVVVPVGSHATATIDVVPGRYVVRAYLPSGSFVSKQVTAVAESTTEVVLESERSAHEWLGWQSLVQLGAATASEDDGPQAILPRLHLVEATDGALIWDALSRAIGTGVHSLPEVSARLPPGVRVQAMRDARTASFVVESSGLRPGKRHIAVVERGRSVEIVWLPIPWRSVDRSGETIYARVDLAVPRGTKGQVGTAVRDPDLGALLGFIASGQVPLAEVMLRPGTRPHNLFIDALWRKLDNPYAAAAGAWVLLQTDPGRDRPWHAWVENLAKWFPWLPDGAALLGSLRLQYATTSEEVRSARRAFETALQRGVPVFAPVLRVLLDGVSTLVEAPDTNAGRLRRYLPQLRAVAGVMATNQVLTTLQLRGRS